MSGKPGLSGDIVIRHCLYVYSYRDKIVVVIFLLCVIAHTRSALYMQTHRELGRYGATHICTLHASDYIYIFDQTSLICELAIIKSVQASVVDSLLRQLTSRPSPLLRGL